MHRRSLLKLVAGSGAALAAGPAFARTPEAVPAFARLQVSPDRVVRSLAGLRPFRESGFVVRAERFDRRKTLVHHYGHGGAGITMSWGTAALAVEAMLAATDERSVAILGCGVIGLTTALMLRRRGFETTIYAEALPPHTTSNIAAAAWGPSYLYRRNAVDENFLHRFRLAARYSQRMFQHYVNDPGYGVRWIRCYDFSSRAPSGESAPNPLADLYPGSRLHADPEAWFGYPSVHSYHTLMIDPDIYLRALMRDFERAGGRITMARFEEAGQISRLRERVVVNCTGLGARALFGDETLRPMRGQLSYLMPQAEIDYGYVTGTPEGTLYMYPRQSAIVLGGTSDLDDWSTDPDPAQIARMLAGHAEVAARISAG